MTIPPKKPQVPLPKPAAPPLKDIREGEIIKPTLPKPPAPPLKNVIETEVKE